jgi:hypothetical protein
VVEPDGSAPFTCEWVTSNSDSGAYLYRRSSSGGPARGLSGAPAYEATGSVTWSVRFKLGDRPVPIAGAPTELTGPKMTTPAEVAEVQTIITARA